VWAMSEFDEQLDQLAEYAHELRAAEILIDVLEAQNARLERGYTATGLDAWPCPGCKYENNVFVEHCTLHETIQSQAEALRELRGEIVWLRAAPGLN